MAGEEIDLNVKVAKLLKAGQSELTDEARALIEQFPPDAQLLDRIRGDYPRLLRGKTWLGTLSRHICAQGRMVQHAPIAVLTYGMRSGGPLSKSLIDQIQTLLGKA